MSPPHLRALREALARKGGRVVGAHPGDDYRTSASWEIERSNRAPKLFLDFEGMDKSGDYCLPLQKSYACQVRGRPAACLYFYRFNRSRGLWERELTAFLEALEAASCG